MIAISLFGGYIILLQAKLSVFDGADLETKYTSTTQNTLSVRAPDMTQTQPETLTQDITIEEEQLNVTMTGCITTKEGKEISIAHTVSIQRSFIEDFEFSSSGQAEVKDPLVINYARGTTKLSQEKFQFDIDANGSSENIAKPEVGSGFLALDKKPEPVD